MVEMTSYTATARRGTRRWVVQCDQVPGAITEVTRLDQAAEYLREAISFVAQVNEADVHVTINPVVDAAIAAELREVENLRTRARTADQEAAALHRSVAAHLQGEGLTLRDIGTILGLSYQRAQQLLT